jgi:hypothetical protein
MRAPTHRPNGGVADGLDETKAAFRAAAGRRASKKADEKRSRSEILLRTPTVANRRAGSTRIDVLPY